MKIILIILLLISFLPLKAENINKSRTFFCTKSNKINIRNGPSKEFVIKFIITTSNFPLLLKNNIYDWYLVEDYEGRDGWVNKSLLKTKCKSIVIKNTELYRIIKGKKTAIFILQKGNLVVVKKCNKKFCQVMFDKKFGFVKKENLWGIV